MKSSLLQFCFLFFLFQSNVFAQINCDENIFYGFNQEGEIFEFELLDDEVYTHGIKFMSPDGTGLGIVSDIDNGLDPGFYVSNAFKSELLYSSGDGNWESMFFPDNLYNPAAYSKYVYFMDDGFNNLPANILKYDGSEYTTFYSWDSLNFSVADLAIDSEEQVYCFLTDGTNEFLDVISVDGNLVKRYDLELPISGKFGMIILNDLIGIGIWDLSTDQSSLFTYKIESDELVKIDSFLLPDEEWYDFASCVSGSPLHTVDKQWVEAIVFPNPTSNFATISLGDNFILDNSMLTIVNLLGQRLFTSVISQKEMQIDFSNFDNGVYYINFKNNLSTHSLPIVISK